MNWFKSILRRYDDFRGAEILGGAWTYLYMERVAVHADIGDLEAAELLMNMFLQAKGHKTVAVSLGSPDNPSPSLYKIVRKSGGADVKER